MLRQQYGARGLFLKRFDILKKTLRHSNPNAEAFFSALRSSKKGRPERSGRPSVSLSPSVLSDTQRLLDRFNLFHGISVCSGIAFRTMHFTFDFHIELDLRFCT